MFSIFSKTRKVHKQDPKVFLGLTLPEVHAIDINRLSNEVRCKHYGIDPTVLRLQMAFNVNKNLGLDDKEFQVLFKTLADCCISDQSVVWLLTLLLRTQGCLKNCFGNIDADEPDAFDFAIAALNVSPIMSAAFGEGVRSFMFNSGSLIQPEQTIKWPITLHQTALYNSVIKLQKTLLLAISRLEQRGLENVGPLKQAMIDATKVVITLPQNEVRSLPKIKTDVAVTSLQAGLVYLRQLAANDVPDLENLTAALQRLISAATARTDGVPDSDFVFHVPGRSAPIPLFYWIRETVALIEAGGLKEDLPAEKVVAGMISMLNERIRHIESTRTEVIPLLDDFFIREALEKDKFLVPAMSR